MLFHIHPRPAADIMIFDIPRLVVPFLPVH